MLPADQFVLKVHSRCDLACDHCYVYESADQSWRGRPLAVSRDVASRLALRIAEHVKTHELNRVEVVLHGGEPLLAGVSRLRDILLELEGALSGLCRLDVKVHTNGVGLTADFCDLFAAHGVSVGVSLDGDRAANDRHRLYRNGRSSYDAAVGAIRLLASDRYRPLYAGLLCTIDLANDPVTVYESLLALNPPRIDFLLPHATHDSPPARLAAAGTDYADWLIAIFDRWQADRYPVRIRTFDSITATLAGADSSTEALGLAPVRTVVIETDGSYEQADSLKVTYDGAAATGLDVFRHSLDSVLQHPGVTGRQQGIADLSPTCQQCPVVTTCGGGMYAHRYRSGTGFDNPSVYCGDLRKLIEHVRDSLPHVRPARDGRAGLTDQAFGPVDQGFSDAGAVADLALGQRSLQRGLIAAVYEATMRASAISASVREQSRDAWQTLATVEGSQPGAVDAVLRHPYLRTWSEWYLQGSARTAPDGQASSGQVVEPALGPAHLGAIAVTAAIRGQVKARATVPVLAGALYLPGLGRLVPAVADIGRAIVAVDADWVTVRSATGDWRLPTPGLLAGESCRAESCLPDRPPGTAGPVRWEPVRVLTAPGIRVALDDVDPCRHFLHDSAASRLSEADFARWQDAFSLAWREITAHHEAYAPALTAGLTTLTPVAPGSVARGRARRAFGVVGAWLPADPVLLALLLIREFQRAKLGAIFDLCDLFEPVERPLGRTRPHADQDPLERLLSDTYAGLAVCAFWGTRAALGGDDAAPARERYRRWHGRTAAAIGTLTGCAALTSLGHELIGQLRIGLQALSL
ncbi:MAG TPA: FxsB family cyclophane-forming radical SAM/SPASM peptide maturase [Trebonia sp.]|nr:FxsB family cyclophane-forming radical SAM/SPASM peptide maturase [Trebonia sp.]